MSRDDDVVLRGPPDVEAPAPRRAAPSSLGVLGQFGRLGVASQAAVPGVYAWAVTVAPAAWGRGAGPVAKGCAALGIFLLLGAAVGEVRWPRLGRLVSVWGFSVASALAWAVASSSAAWSHVDAVRGLTGMIGWGLFAYASAAPARTARTASTSAAAPLVRDAAPLASRAKLARGDGLYLVLGVALLVGLQLVGWRTTTPERALLVRLVLLAAGLGVLGGATSASLARHARALPASRRHRLRPTLLWALLFAVSLLAGLLAWLFVMHAPSPLPSP